jgi:hypothetical protein
MTRRFDIGPILVMLGALLLLASLFVDWYEGNITAWTAFEALDLALAALALAAVLAAAGLLAPGAALVDRRFLPGIVLAVAAIVAVQVIDPPPAALNRDPETGAWLALASVLLMCAGTLVTFGRVSLAVTVEGRDTRRRVTAVDARGGEDWASPGAGEPAPGGGAAGRGDRERSRRGTRPFGGEDAAATDPFAEPPTRPEEPGARATGAPGRAGPVPGEPGARAAPAPGRAPVAARRRAKRPLGEEPATGPEAPEPATPGGAAPAGEPATPGGAAPAAPRAPTPDPDAPVEPSPRPGRRPRPAAPDAPGRAESPPEDRGT